MDLPATVPGTVVEVTAMTSDDYVICWLCNAIVNKANAEIHDWVWICNRCWSESHD